MKRLLSSLCILSILYGCNNPANDSPSPNMVLGGKSYLKINLTNISDTLNFSYWYNETLPEDQYGNKLNVFADTTFIETLHVSQPTTINFFNNNRALRFFVIPDDTLEVSFDFQKNGELKDIVSYKGLTGSICEYLNEGKFFYWNNHPEKDETPEHYNQRIDSLTSIAFDSFNKYLDNHSLSEWYVKHEKSDLFFKGELLKLMQYNQHFWMYNQFVPKEDRLTKTMKEELKRLTWITDEPITLFLTYVRPAVYDTLLRPEYVTDDIFFQYIHDNISELKEVLPAYNVSVIVASRVSDLLYDNKLLKLSPEEFDGYTARVDSFLDANAALITDTTIRKFIYDFRDRQYLMVKNKKRLEVGSPAPDFYLQSLDGSSKKLSEFKGKTVLLTFWTTSCVYCIKSIPAKNQLLKTFEGEGFVLVSICTDGNIKGWREIIRNNKYEGNHFICKGNWSSILGEKYNIMYVPHYTLINNDGLVVKNAVHRDSLEYYIKASL